MPAPDPQEKLPVLRRVEAVPVQQGGQTIIMLRDPSGLAENSVGVAGLGAVILSFLDGEHTLREVQVALTRQTGQLIMSDQIEGIVRQLDEAKMLETPALYAFREQRLADYRASGVRACADGVGYPSDPTAFAAMVDSWMARLREREEPLEGDVTGAIAPHIDFGRGAAGYAHVYRDIADACDADLFVIIGTDHFGDTQFSATRNDFETPLGTVKTAGDVVDRLASGFIGDLFEGELQHLGEHTVEFQAVLLQHFLGGRRDFEIVPILCGGFGEELLEGETELQDAETLSLIDCLSELLVDNARRTCIIASADLSHVGPRFGGDRSLTGSYLSEVEAYDRVVLEHAISGDADAMFAAVSARGNDTNICGLGPIYIALRALGDCRRELLHYEQATSPDRQQSVSFAAATFSHP